MSGPPEVPLVAESDRLRLRSIHSEQPTDLEFVNERSERVHLYWINFKARRMHYADLDPGDRAVMHTYLTHPWVVCDSADRRIAFFLPVPAPSRAVIR